jgi:DNA modification methylase
MPGGSVDFVFADPPYGISTNREDRNRHTRVGVEPVRSIETCGHVPGDFGAEDRQLQSLVESSLLVMKPIMAKHGVVCVCSAACGEPGRVGFALVALALSRIFVFEHPVVWSKGNGAGWKYRRTFERVFVASNNGKLRWFAPKEKAVMDVISHIRRVHSSKIEYQSEKPVELPAFFISNHTKTGDLVLDPFVGAGSTLLAAHQMGRRFIGIDLNSAAIDISHRRLTKAGAQFEYVDLRDDDDRALEERMIVEAKQAGSISDGPVIKEPDDAAVGT